MVELEVFPRAAVHALATVAPPDFMPNALGDRFSMAGLYGPVTNSVSRQKCSRSLTARRYVHFLRALMPTARTMIATTTAPAAIASPGWCLTAATMNTPPKTSTKSSRLPRGFARRLPYPYR